MCSSKTCQQHAEVWCGNGSGVGVAYVICIRNIKLELDAGLLNFLAQDQWGVCIIRIHQYNMYVYVCMYAWMNMYVRMHGCMYVYISDVERYCIILISMRKYIVLVDARVLAIK